MTELEEATERILKSYPKAFNIIPEPDQDWVERNYEGGILWTGFDTWKCTRHGGTFSPRPEYMRAYRFSIMEPDCFDKSKLSEEYYHLVITECPDPMCKDNPHKLCVFY